MKMSFKILALLSLLAIPALVQAEVWTIDPVHSKVGFKVKHMMVTNVYGDFGSFSGTVDINDKDLTQCKVDVKIDAASVNTGIAQRDTHLKSADFFDVTKFPQLTFVSKKIAVTGQGQLEMTGDFTMHGVTKSIVLKVDGPSPAFKDPMGIPHRGASASVRINRKDYGLGWNKAIEAGGVMVAEDVDISLDVELVKK